MRIIIPILTKTYLSNKTLTYKIVLTYSREKTQM